MNTTSFNNQNQAQTTFNPTDLPGDPSGQCPMGVAQWVKTPYCIPMAGVVNTKVPASYPGHPQKWVTGPKGQNFAEGDNFGSYNCISVYGEIYPPSLGTPNFTLDTDVGTPVRRSVAQSRIDAVAMMDQRHQDVLSPIQTGLICVAIFTLMCVALVIYLNVR